MQTVSSSSKDDADAALSERLQPYPLDLGSLQRCTTGLSGSTYVVVHTNTTTKSQLDCYASDPLSQQKAPTADLIPGFNTSKTIPICKR